MSIEKGCRHLHVTGDALVSREYKGGRDGQHHSLTGEYFGILEFACPFWTTSFDVSTTPLEFFSFVRSASKYQSVKLGGRADAA